MYIGAITDFPFCSGVVDDGERSYHIEPIEDSEVRFNALKLFLNVNKGINIKMITLLTLFFKNVYQFKRGRFCNSRSHFSHCFILPLSNA